MKADTLDRKLIKCYLILIVLVMLMVGIWMIFCVGFPEDILRENITLEDAQSLVSFRICTPTYIPRGIDPHAQIIYESDAANVPEETYIRLRFHDRDGDKKEFEVYQKYTRDEGMRTAYTESRSEGAKIILLYWMFYPKFLSESDLVVAKERIQLNASVFQADQTVWWLYEIVDPSEYRSTMTEWIRNHVEYWILSYLPAEELEKVTLSMFECSILNP